MKNFLKKNLAIIIFIGVLLIAGAILGIAIYRVSSQKEPEIIVKDNIVLKYVGSSKEVVIDENVTAISVGAFESKSTIQKVSFAGASKLQSIGSKGFYECSSLVNIVLPKGLQLIGTHAFDFCTSLETIIIPEGVTTIEDYAFANCRNLKSVSLPSTLTELGEQVFANCNELETITSKSDNFVVENGALYNADKSVLYKYIPTNQSKSYEAPETLKEVKAYAFENCANLTSIVIGKSVTKMGVNAFIGCEALVEVTVPFLGSSPAAKDSAIFAYFFDKVPSTITSVTVLGGEIIPVKAFDACTKIKTLVVGEGVTRIGELAFRSCTGLREVVLPSSIKTISSGAFTGCNKVGKIYFNQVEKDFGTDWNPVGLEVYFLEE